tara:strand:+ start:191 stop:3946 length:3756 start_codon:yes stop_codon:yes gene_type:complete
MPKQIEYTHRSGKKAISVVPDFYTEEQIADEIAQLEGRPSAKQIETKVDPEETVPVDDESTSDQPTTTQVLQGLAAEIAIASAGQFAGAALTPATLGVGWLGATFSSGYAGSVAAQEIEGREDFQYGRALAAGFINMIPFGSTLNKMKLAAAATGQTLTKKQVIAEMTKVEAARGAALAGTETTISSLIDKQEMPSASEFLGITAVGGVFGGTVGRVMGKWGARNLASKAPEQIDADIANGIVKSEEAAKFINATDPKQNVSGEKIKIESIANTEKNDAKNVLSKTLGAPSKLFKMFTDAPVLGKDLTKLREFDIRVRPTRYTGRDVKEADWTYTNEVRALEETGFKIANRVRKYSEANKGSEQHINNYLDTGVVHSSLANKSIMGDLKYARDIIPEYSNHFIKQIDNFSFSKINKEGQEALIKEANDNLTKKKYYTQEYEMYTNKDWRPDVKKKNAAVAEIYQNLKDAQTSRSRKTDEELVKEAALTINSIEEKALWKANLKTGTKATTTESGILEGKKLTPAKNKKQMEYMGLITDPSERIRGTITKLGKIVARNEADISIAKSLAKSGLAVAQPPNANYSRLTLPSGLETGLFVPDEVQFSLTKNYIEPFNEKTGDMTTDLVRDVWSTAVSASKAAKVIFNPPSYAVNAFGGVTTMLGMGMNPFKGGFYNKGLKIALSEYAVLEKQFSGKTAGERESLIRLMDDAAKYGLSSGNVDVSDIRNGLKNKEGLAGLADKAIQPFAKAYQATDIAARYSVWANNQQVLSRLIPDLKGDDLKLAAAKLTNDTFQNYEKLSPIIKTLSRYGAMPQFVAFTAEFTRNIYNQARFAKQMIQGNFGQELGIDITNANKAAMRAEGIKRMTALSATIGAAYGGSQVYNHSQGFDEEKQRVYKESVVADFNANKALVFSKDPQDPNKVTTMNMSYIVPHAMFAEGFEAAISDKPISSVYDVFMENFTGEGSFVFQSVAGGLKNQGKYGRPISSQPEGIAKTGELISEVVSEIFSLGAQREVGLLVESLTNKESKYTPFQVLLRQVGFRNYSSDLKESATSRVRITSDNVANLKSEYNGKVKGGRLTEGQRQELFTNNNAVLKKNVEVLINHKNNLSSLEQLEINDVAEILKDTGLDSLTVLGIMEDEFIDMEYEPAVNISDIFDELSIAAKEDGQDITKKIREYAGRDYLTRKKLMGRYKQDREDKARGVSSIDRLIKGLSADKQVRYFEIKGDAEFKRARSKGLVKKETFIKRSRSNR